MRDERSGFGGLCEGLSTVHPIKGPLGCEVTSSVADPNGTGNPKPGTHLLATVPQQVGAPLAGESSSRRMVSSCVSTDQGFCFRKQWREMFFRCFRRLSAQPGCLWSFTRREPKVTRGNLELATPGVASTRSPSWAAPGALFYMCREGGLEGRFSVWAGAGWWARSDLGELS